jgi:hypothetical protein
MESEMRSRRDSWPPTLLHLEPPRGLNKNGEPRALLDIDDEDDPLTYFLTPATPYEDQEDGDNNNDNDVIMMDFDAGIEDPSQPRTIVRSVSPSTLDGLRKPSSRAAARCPSPDFDSDVASPDEDEEEYIRFSPSDSTRRRFTSFRDLYVNGLSQRPESPVFGVGAGSTGISANALLSPASFASPPPAPTRHQAQPTLRVGRARSSSVRSRPTAHLWREPSPDVWSIEEETEEEMSDARQKAVDQKAAKPKKRVRFVLPFEEMESVPN